MKEVKRSQFILLSKLKVEIKFIIFKTFKKKSLLGTFKKTMFLNFN